MYFTAVASLVPLQGEIPLKLGSGARLFILQSYRCTMSVCISLRMLAVANLMPLQGKPDIPLVLKRGSIDMYILQ